MIFRVASWDLHEDKLGRIWIRMFQSHCHEFPHGRHLFVEAKTIKQIQDDEFQEGLLNNLQPDPQP